jgi:O-antigen/teichoic acid export membrane protein
LNRDGTGGPGAVESISRQTRTLASGAGIALVGKVGGRLLAFAGDILAARILGPVEFGLYAIGWTVLRMVSLFVLMGLENGIIRFSLRQEDDTGIRSVVWQSIGAVLLVGGLVGALVFTNAEWLAREVFSKPGLEPVLRLFAPGFLFLPLLSVLAATTRVSRRVIYSVASLDLGQPVLALSLLGAFYLLGGRITAVIGSDIVSAMIATLIALFFVHRLLPNIFRMPMKQRLVLPQVLQFSAPSALAGIFAVFVVWFGRLIVGYYLPASQGGIYQAASQLSTIFAIVLAAFGAIQAPLYVEAQRKGDWAQLEHHYRVGTKWGLYLSLPVFVTLILMPREIMVTLFGPAYAEGWLALSILSVGQLVNIATGTVGVLLVMTGNNITWLRQSGLAFVVNLALSIILVPRLGIIGSAISTSLSLSLLFISGILRARRLLHIWPYDRRYLKGIRAIVFTGVVLVPVKVFLHLGPAWELVLIGSLSILLFAGFLVAQKLDEEDWEFIRLARQAASRMMGGSDTESGGVENVS